MLDCFKLFGQITNSLCGLFFKGIMPFNNWVQSTVNFGLDAVFNQLCELLEILGPFFMPLLGVQLGLLLCLLSGDVGELLGLLHGDLSELIQVDRRHVRCGNMTEAEMLRMSNKKG